MNEISTDSRESLSSKDIALLTGKQHKHILRDIREMLAQLEKDSPNLDYLQSKYSISKDSRGYTREYCLDKDLSLTLATQYSAYMRYQIIQRWQVLEQHVASTPSIDMNKLAAVVANSVATALAATLPQIVENLGQAQRRKLKSPARNRHCVPETPSLPSLERINIRHRVNKLAEATRYSEPDIYTCLYDNLALCDELGDCKKLFREARRDKHETILVWIERHGFLPVLSDILANLECRYGRVAI